MTSVEKWMHWGRRMPAWEWGSRLKL